jgi:hypothetical protein
MKVQAIFILALITGLAATAQSQNSETETVLRTAKSQINSFIKDLPDDGLADYGFLDRKEFGKINFGTPIPIYTWKDSTVVFTSTWRVPVVIEKEYRSLLTVILENGVYKAVDFGASELAKAYAANRTPKTIGMLRVYEIKSDFLIEETEKGSQVYIKLEFNR